MESTGFSVVLCRTYGRRSLLYTLGACGRLDKLKVAIKKRRLVDVAVQACKGLPLGAALLLAYTPLWCLGEVCDRISGSGHKLMLIARKLG